VPDDPAPPDQVLSETVGAIQLDAVDLSVAAALVVLAGVVSIVLRLHLEKRLAVAALRTVVQLLLVGYVLRAVFEMDRLLPVMGIALLMVAAASRASVQRPSRSFAGVTWRAFLTLVASALLTTVTVTAAVVRVDPWYEPQYLVPLLGMALGNGLTGISLCLDHVLAELDERRELVELELALGATAWEAARRPLSEAVRRGMIPIINSMTVAGIVALPGMMTGQILAGADPVEAVKYQVVVMFLIAASTSLGCIVLALLVFRRLFNERHQLLTTQIRRRA
jgi:putative ABC transport system permease protein